MNQIKLWLEQARNLKEEIYTLEREEQLLRTMAEKATTSFVQGGRGKGNFRDQVAVGALELSSLEEELEKQRRSFAQLYREIATAISQLPSATHRSVLRMRYLSNLPWKEISSHLGYTRGGVWYQHQQALEELKKRKDCLQ